VLGEIFFKKTRENFEESIRHLESRMTNSMNLANSDFKDDNTWTTPRIFNADFDSVFGQKDIATLQHVDDDEKMEIHLDTCGYKPGELKVQVGKGIVSVEGKHEEKSEAGQIMVSRQFSRQYCMPEGSKEEEVNSSLSKDGILVVSVPKHKTAIQQDNRNVPISLK